MGNGADYGPPQSAAPATPTPDPSTVEALRAQTEGATRDSAAPAAPMPLPSQVAAPRGGNFAPIPPQAAVAPDPSAVPNPSAVSNRMGGDEASARRLWQVVAQSFKAAEQRAIPSEDIDNVGSIAGEERVPFWEQPEDYAETQRKDRRTIFMHDDWVRHRSSERFLRNMLSIPSSGINRALYKELVFVTSVAAFVVAFNCLFVSYQGAGGVVHPGPLNFLDANLKTMSLPALPFTIAMPALSLLLVFRTNTAYSRWNEARTLWGGLINNCRNVVRQSNQYFPDDARHTPLKRRMAAETTAFARALRNFLRGPSDDDVLRGELYELVSAGLMSPAQAEATMSASNRPMFCLQAMSATLRRADIDSMNMGRIDTSISVLVDLTGANERIFKSPIPLMYTRLLARFLSVFLVLMPLGLWQALGESWNHRATIPATFVISFFLFGIEEAGIQLEEPFSVLPIEAFCNGAIAAAADEMLAADGSKVFDEVPVV